ncbi:16S rRNA (uracil(1498)-N(3))-methyltransferase [Glacieibacterium sp.]|uniref:16S rRNA (uracil(1498)-N(3))-methyltransferase n=1 Tax=Glacieibacterium sp. TaxID=2860237 RepID=UPI003B00EAD6
MSENPAPESSTPTSSARLFVEAALGQDVVVTLPGPASHYLSGVMRLGVGDTVRLFDDRSGEWLARLVTVGRKAVGVVCEARLRERETVPDLWLCAAPLKRGRIDWLAEKACELGVARLVPVTTRRTVVDKLNLDRLRAHMIEAAEQCGRTALPELGEPVTLAMLLRDWPAGRTLVFADETGGISLVQAAKPGPAGILIGPEGGFTPDERTAIRAVPGAIGVSLGPRILRADTAAAVAVGVWQALAGDW